VKTFRITPIEKERSALVGTSFHITMGAVEVEDLSYGKGASVHVKIVRPSPENGQCAFWSAARRAVVSVPLKAGPAGASLAVD
jgi:hypothetical protein